MDTLPRMVRAERTFMAITVHPTAIVDKNAQLGEGVEIGPYAMVGADVKLGAGTVVKHGAIVDGHTTIGEKCQIFPYHRMENPYAWLPIPVHLR